MMDLVELLGSWDAGKLVRWLEWAGSKLGNRLLDPVALRDYAKLSCVLGVTILLEMARKKNWRIRYGSRNFRVDVCYYIFYYSGLYHVLFFSWIYRGLTGLVGAHAPWLQMNLLHSMSPVIQMLVLVVAADFFGYWSHRIKHGNRYLWAFHSIHHSQTTLTAVTNYRFHIVDETLLRLWLFIPFQILGTDVVLWLTLDFIMAWVLLVQHSDWNWSYGWVGRIFVSPRFHRIHHAIDESSQDRNYAMLFSFWDDLFGTAERRAPCPKEHGIAGHPVPESLAGQFIYPFAKILGEFRSARASPVESALTVPPQGK